MTRTNLATPSSAESFSNTSKTAISRMFLRFVVAGCAAAATNFGSRILFSLVATFEYAVILAHVVGMVTAFTAFRVFVFEPSGRRVRYEIMSFLMVNAWSLTQVWIISVLLYRYGLPAVGWVWRPDMVAHATGIASTVAVSFICHKSLTFRRSPAAHRAASPALDNAERLQVRPTDYEPSP